MDRWRLWIGLVYSLVAGLIAGCAVPTSAFVDGSAGVATIASLDQISTEGLRSRSYATSVEALAWQDCPSLGEGAVTRIVEYVSDGLRVYARLDVPSLSPPGSGYPVLIFAHGWVGAEGAPEYDFACGESSSYGTLIQAYLDAGYVALVPGFRGHGIVNGIPADGGNWLIAFDNGSYLSPAFYTIDLLNLLSGLDALPSPAEDALLPIDAGRVVLAGHSQGGDVILSALAATGEGAPSGLEVSAASIWAGTFVDRFTQLETYGPMETARSAFLDGDGSWNGTAAGASGDVNPDFIFAYPPHWIDSPHPEDWGWQAGQWSAPSVEAVISVKLDELYETLNVRVGSVSGATFSTNRDRAGQLVVEHDLDVVSQMAGVGGAGYPEYLREPLNLHTSDRDFYSWPEWNLRLCADINVLGGTCRAYIYPGNTHNLQLAEDTWFSPPASRSGFDLMLRRDLSRFARDTSGLPAE